MFQSLIPLIVLSSLASLVLQSTITWRLTSEFTSFQVFLKYYHVEYLNLMVQQATQRVVLLQAYIRGWLGARRYRRTLTEREHSALVLQSGL